MIIDRGRLVAFEPLGRLTARVTGDVRVRAPEVRRLRESLTDEGIRSTLLGGDVLHVEGATTERIGELAFAVGVPLHELAPRSSSLEDVFFELTNGGPS
jgi:ABC-2 type transport system ATP-binding protein